MSISSTVSSLHNLHELSPSSRPPLGQGGGGVSSSCPGSESRPHSPRRRCPWLAGRQPWSNKSNAGNLFHFFFLFFLFLKLLPSRLRCCQERVMSATDPTVTPPWPFHPCRFIKSSSFVARLLDLTHLDRVWWGDGRGCSWWGYRKRGAAVEVECHEVHMAQNWNFTEWRHVFGT